MGAGGLAAAIAGRVEGSAAVASDSAEARALDVRVGQRFGRWTVAAVHPIHGGALHLDVKGEDGHAFVLELQARDSSPVAPRAPATTEGLAIFVRNGGDGWHPTAEEQGLAAMALADMITASGQGGANAGLLTYTERFARHHDVLTGEFTDTTQYLV